jgi:acetolactate synthase-1/2/3 large subunit
MLGREILLDLHHCKRPLFIFGAGMRHAAKEARDLVAMLGIPVAPTWGARDLFPEWPSFGTHGERSANLAIQNADYIVCVGSRLDTKATGSPASGFAPRAKLVMVDIDSAELLKMAKIGRPLFKAIQSDAKDFISDCLSWARAIKEHDGGFDFSEWSKQVEAWKEPLPDLPHYRAIQQISERSSPDDVIVCDTGLVLAWTMRAFKFKGQRFLHPFNMTPMGYALPAAVGAYYATGQSVIVLTGDGSIMMNIGELATIAGHGLPIQIYLVNNHGHGMVRQSERQWFHGKHCATDLKDLSFPDFLKVGNAFDVDLTVIEVDPEAELEGQVKYGEPIAEAA